MNFAAANYILAPKAAPRQLPAKSEKLISLQVLRAFAALAVTVFHLRPYFGVKLGIRDLLPGSLSVGAVGVQVFFVISGFVVVYSSAKLFDQPGSSREFFIRRCIRIVPLYWGLSFIILCHTFYVYGASALPPSVVASFAFVPMPRFSGLMYPLLVAGWTLNYEMFFYAVFAIGMMLLRPSLVVFGVSAFFAGIVAISALVGPIPQPLAFWTNAIILEFVAGMFLALAYRSGIALPGWASVSLIILGLIGFGLSYGWHHSPRAIAWGAATLVVAGAVLGPELDGEHIVWKALSLLGDASYSLYLLHPFAFSLPGSFFFRLINPTAAPWAYASLLVFSAVLVAIAVHLRKHPAKAPS